MVATSNPARQGDESLQQSLVEAWLKSQSSPNTLAAYRSDMAKFGSWCVSQGAIALRADTATLVAFQMAREAAGDSPATVRRRWSALSSFYDFVLNNQAASGNPSINPVLGVTRPRVRSGDPSPTARLSAGVVDVYRAVAASLDPRLEVLVGLLVSDGLKVGEVLALDVDDISGKPPKTTITVSRRGETRRITLHPDSARAIRRCIGSRRNGPLLTSGRATQGQPQRRLTRFGADHLIRQLSEGRENRVTANELRRFHISKSHEQDEDLEEVRERAGLADVRGVRRYIAQS